MGEERRPEEMPSMERHAEIEKTPEKEKAFATEEMKIEVTNVCQFGRCRFCSPCFRPTVEEAGAEEFLKKMEGNLDTYLRGGGRKIILTGGGEPIDAPKKFFGTLKLINKKLKGLGVNLDLLAVYSNGVGLLEPVSKGSDKTFVDEMLEYGVRDLNISVHGLTKEERIEIAGEYMGNIDFDTLIPRIVENNMRIMTRTTLSKGFIDSVDKVKQFTKWMSGLGVKRMYFSDLFFVPPEVRGPETTPGSQEALEWTDKHRIDFDKLVDDVKKCKDFEFVVEYARHREQGRTLEFRHKESGITVLFGALTIGDEPVEAPTYAYVKPDGSMDAHNNARDLAKRKYVPLETVAKYRPGRPEREFQQIVQLHYQPKKSPSPEQAGKKEGA